MTEREIREELTNIVQNEPVFPGDTISHATANECVRRGWARRDDRSYFVSTDLGEAVDTDAFHADATVENIELISNMTANAKRA